MDKLMIHLYSETTSTVMLGKTVRVTARVRNILNSKQYQSAIRCSSPKSGLHTVYLGYAETPSRQCCGSRFNGVPGSVSGRRAKLTHKNRKKVGCSLLRAEGFSCSLGVLYGGLGISKLQFLIKKENKIFHLFFSSSIFGHQNHGS